MLKAGVHPPTHTHTYKGRTASYCELGFSLHICRSTYGGGVLKGGGPPRPLGEKPPRPRPLHMNICTAQHIIIYTRLKNYSKYLYQKGKKPKI